MSGAFVAHRNRTEHDLRVAPCLSMAKDRFIYGVDRISSDRVSKFHGDSAECEFEKATTIYNALAGTQFRSPKPLTLDLENHRIEYEFIENRGLLQESIERTRTTRSYLALFRLNRAAGRLLAIVHRDAIVEKRRIWTAPRQFSGRFPESALTDGVCLHGDYSPVNILVLSENRIAAIDSTPNVYFTDLRTNFGPRLVDLATYTAKLTWPFRMQNYAPAWLRVLTRLRADFIRAYELQAQVRVDQDSLKTFEALVPPAFVYWRSSRATIRFAATGVCHFASLYQRVV